MVQEKQVLEWSSESLQLNQIEMLWHALRQSSAKQFCKEEWAEDIATYHESFLVVLAAMGGTTSQSYGSNSFKHVEMADLLKFILSRIGEER